MMGGATPRVIGGPPTGTCTAQVATDPFIAVGADETIQATRRGIHLGYPVRAGLREVVGGRWAFRAVILRLA